MPYYLSDDTFKQLERVIGLSETSEGGGVPPSPQKLPKQIVFAKVTSGTSSPYVGTVEVFNNDGSTTSYTTSAKLWEVNGNSLTIGQAYQALRTGNDGSGNPQYVTSYTPSTPSCTSQSWTEVTNICPIFASGVQIGQNVEYTQFSLAIVDGCPVVTAGTPVCIENPGGCCSGDIDSECLPTTCAVYPNQWNLYFEGLTNTTGVFGCNQCDALNGVTFTLTWLDVICGWRWVSMEACGQFMYLCILAPIGGGPPMGTPWQVVIGCQPGGAFPIHLPLVLDDADFNCIGINSFSGSNLITDGSYSPCCGNPITAIIVPA